MNDTHTAVIDWGDGTGPTAVSVTETAGAGTLSANHVYADDGTYSVSVIVTDDEGASGSDTVSITVGNLPPLVSAGADRTVSEGQTFSIAANFSDPGIADTHTAIFNWGDGTSLQTAHINEASGAGAASASHRYLDNGVYTVTVTVTDNGGTSTLDALMIHVDNVRLLMAVRTASSTRQYCSLRLLTPRHVLTAISLR